MPYIYPTDAKRGLAVWGYDHHKDIKDKFETDGHKTLRLDLNEYVGMLAQELTNEMLRHYDNAPIADQRRAEHNLVVQLCYMFNLSYKGQDPREISLISVVARAYNIVVNRLIYLQSEEVDEDADPRMLTVEEYRHRSQRSLQTVEHLQRAINLVDAVDEYFIDNLQHAINPNGDDE